MLAVRSSIASTLPVAFIEPSMAVGWTISTSIPASGACGAAAAVVEVVEGTFLEQPPQTAAMKIAESKSGLKSFSLNIRSILSPDRSLHDRRRCRQLEVEQ